jgi:putative chitinase
LRDCALQPLAEKHHALLCGVADFVHRGCLPYARADDLLNVTRHLNGGTVGLAERRQWLARWKALSPTVGAAAILPAAPHPSLPDVPKPVPPSAPSITHPSRGSIGAWIKSFFTKGD